MRTVLTRAVEEMQNKHGKLPLVFTEDIRMIFFKGEVFQDRQQFEPYTLKETIKKWVRNCIKAEGKPPISKGQSQLFQPPKI